MAAIVAAMLTIATANTIAAAVAGSHPLRARLIQRAVVDRTPICRIGISTKRYDSSAATEVIIKAMAPRARALSPSRGQVGRAAVTRTNTGQCHR